LECHNGQDVFETQSTFRTHISGDDLYNPGVFPRVPNNSCHGRRLDNHPDSFHDPRNLGNVSNYQEERILNFETTEETLVKGLEPMRSVKWKYRKCDSTLGDPDIERLAQVGLTAIENDHDRYILVDQFPPLGDLQRDNRPQRVGKDLASNNGFQTRASPSIRNG
jgi:hypothetical protein